MSRINHFYIHYVNYIFFYEIFKYSQSAETLEIVLNVLKFCNICSQLVARNMQTITKNLEFKNSQQS